MPNSPRKYKSEYARYQAAELQKKKRAARNKARRMMLKAGAVRPGDKKDVSHRNGTHLIIEEKILQFSLNLRIGLTLEIEKLEKDFMAVKGA